MKWREYRVFGDRFGICGDDDDIQTWTHELTERFLYWHMKIWHSVWMKDVEHLLESKDFKNIDEEEWQIDVCHLAAPYGYNCLIGRHL